MFEYGLLEQMLSKDSTSGRERDFSLWLASVLVAEKTGLMEVGDGSLNLLLSWGEPQVVFCTHVDTVPPYIAPSFDGEYVRGRGACDAKGQIYSMYRACERLAASGRDGFGLLLLSGEETGSFGAKAFAKTGFRAPYVVVGEPTDNLMVSASKGTKAYGLRFRGKAFHSGYPELGRSAVDMFVDFMDRLRSRGFAEDPVLGATSWNVGMLHSGNPQNVLSPSLECRLYFRTTFSSDAAVQEFMESQRCGELEVEAAGGDSPLSYHVPEGFRSRPVSFGSDAPHLSNFALKSICGPGSICVAHRDDECVKVADLEEATENYIRIYESYNKRLRQNGPYGGSLPGREGH